MCVCAELYTLYMSDKMSELQINVQVRILFSPLKKTDPSGFMALVLKRRKKKVAAVLRFFFLSSFLLWYKLVGAWHLNSPFFFFFTLGNSVAR